MAAQSALLHDDGPGELARYLEALALEPDVPGPRRALTAIASSRRAVGDTQTAATIDSVLARASLVR
jgi:hypothetical protein